MASTIETSSRCATGSLSRTIEAARRRGYAWWSVLAFVLLAAALLKAHELATEPVLSENLLRSRPVVLGAIWLEALLAGWMLSGLYRGITRWVVVGCFGVLGVVALALAVGGATSCGCFGRARISPWYTCAFDLGAALAVGLIPGRLAPPLTISQAPRRFAVALVLAIAVGLGATVAAVRTSPNVPGPSQSGDVGAVAGRAGALNDPADQCWLTAARMILAELNLDPNDLDSLKADDVDDVLKAVSEESGRDGQAVREVSVAELLDLGNKEGGIVGAVAGSDGHLYVILGRIKSGEHALYQLMHGSSGPTLVPEAGMSPQRFTRAWRITRNGRPPSIPLKVGRGTLTVSEWFHNFGEVPSRGTITHEFKLFNSGDVPLAFDKPRTSCACTTTSSDKRTILAPGETKTLGVNVLLRNAPSCQQNVVLKLEEPRSNAVRELVLSLLGNQGTFRTSSPELVDFQRVLPGRGYTRTVLVTESDVDRFDIKAVEVGKLPIRWSKTTATNPRGVRVHTIGLELSPGYDLTAGVHTGEVVLVPDVQGPEIPVPIRFNVASWVRVSPQVINLGEVKIGETRSETVRVSSVDGQPVQVEPALVPAEAKVHVETDKESPSMLLHVSFSPREKGFWVSKIKVAARSEERASTIEIQCTGFGKER